MVERVDKIAVEDLSIPRVEAGTDCGKVV